MQIKFFNSTATIVITIITITNFIIIINITIIDIIISCPMYGPELQFRYVTSW